VKSHFADEERLLGKFLRRRREGSGKTFTVFLYPRREGSRIRNYKIEIL
jgi:hypothetical protein